MIDRPKTSSTAGTIQRAAVACQSCRLRKVKCDAQSASPREPCGPCRRAGQECLLEPLSDRRRSVSRKYVDKLQQRIEMLEALNQQIGDRSAWRANEGDTIPPANASVLSCTASTARSTNVTNVGPVQSNDSTNLATPRISNGSQQSLPTSTLINAKPQEKACDGSPSFYGATSHPHVVSPGEESRLPSFDEVDAVGIELDPSSPHLRDHLFQSFFKYQTLWVEIVNKELFLTHQANGVHSQWYCKFLENAMLACATRLSTSKGVRALGPKYLKWAKDEALEALSEPTPANLQGFLLLSEYEVTQGNDRPGWMFCGMACRMLSDLGLHELAGIVNAPEEAQSATRDSDFAYALLSACIVYEGVWTLYLGRPSSIPRPVMNIAASRCRERRKSDSPLLNAWLGLCVPMAEISHILNEQSIGDSDASASLPKLVRQMEDWYENLPPELAYNESRLTNMDLAGYGLHTQYCKVQILLRQALARPRNTKKRRHSQTTGDGSHQMSSNDSNAMIYQYSLRIARLVVTYREAFGVEKVPSIMLDNAVVAATAMIGHLNKSASVNEMQHETIWLRLLVKSMEAVQPHFPIIGRMLDTLKQICGSGPLCIMFFRALPVSKSAPSHELPSLSQSQDLNSNSKNVQEGSYAVESGSDVVWDCFDVDIAQSVFLSGGFDDFAFDVTSSEPLSSGFAQVAC